MVKEDMAEVEVTEEDTEDRNNWRWKIRCGDPLWEKPEEEDSTLGSVDVDSLRAQTDSMKRELLL